MWQQKSILPWSIHIDQILRTYAHKKTSKHDPFLLKNTDWGCMQTISVLPWSISVEKKYWLRTYANKTCLTMTNSSQGQYWLRKYANKTSHRDSFLLRKIPTEDFCQKSLTMIHSCIKNHAHLVGNTSWSTQPCCFQCMCCVFKKHKRIIHLCYFSQKGCALWTKPMNVNGIW